MTRVYTDTPRGQVWTNIHAAPSNNRIAVIGSSTAAKIYREDGTNKCFPNTGVIGADNVHPNGVAGARHIGERLARQTLQALSAIR